MWVGRCWRGQVRCGEECGVAWERVCDGACPLRWDVRAGCARCGASLGLWLCVSSAAGGEVTYVGQDA